MESCVLHLVWFKGHGRWLVGNVTGFFTADDEHDPLLTVQYITGGKLAECYCKPADVVAIEPTGVVATASDLRSALAVFAEQVFGGIACSANAAQLKFGDEQKSGTDGNGCADEAKYVHIRGRTVAHSDDYSNRH